jgi:transcriptional regulator with XRE-family HTH domain
MRARDATQCRDAAIRDARAGGLSLRDIAEAAGLSHTAIAKILTRPAR